MAKHQLRFRCTSIADVERQLIAGDANTEPLIGIVRKVSLSGENGSFVHIEFLPQHAKGFEVGEQYDVTVASIPKQRAPRR